MINKVHLGIPFLDDRQGGVYRKRQVLCCGRQGSGKTVFALHCLMQSVREGERAVMLTSWRVPDLAIFAEKIMGFQLEEAVAGGKVVLLEYPDMISGPEFEQNATLPPESFSEFTQIVETNAATRVIIDTVIPWVAISHKERLARHVYSFVQALDRMGVTSIMTIPKPVSPLAHALKNMLEEQVAVAVTLDFEEGAGRNLLVNKYLGEEGLPPPMAFEIIAGTGMAGVDEGVPDGEGGGQGVRYKPAHDSRIRFASAYRE